MIAQWEPMLRWLISLGLYLAGSYHISCRLSMTSMVEQPGYSSSCSEGLTKYERVQYTDCYKILPPTPLSNFLFQVTQASRTWEARLCAYGHGVIPSSRRFNRARVTPRENMS